MFIHKGKFVKSGADVVYVPTCLCTNVPEGGANLSFANQGANVPKSVPIFQIFLLRNAKVNYYMP